MVNRVSSYFPNHAKGLCFLGRPLPKIFKRANVNVHQVKVSFNTSLSNISNRLQYAMLIIMITCPCNLYPLTPHFYILKLGFTGVYVIFLLFLFALKHSLWVLVRTASPQSMF